MYVTNALKANKYWMRSICLFYIVVGCKSSVNQYTKIKGNVFGTTFLVKYIDNNQRDFTQDIALLFNDFNNSLSTYHQNSTISTLNKGLSEIEVEDEFKSVFQLSKKIYKNTEGYFDPTIGKMVNAWGFGPVKIKSNPTHTEVDSLMNFVGFDKVKISDHTIIKENAEIYLDFNAIAKGYGVDVIGRFLESKGVKNYLVEIGGEIRVKGINDKNKLWSVGIEEPNFDGTRSLQRITQLNNESIATSGNYRKYKIDSITGKKIAHTLNPKTGFPAETDMLSASVIAPVSCGEVDAYATAFMAMGFEKAKILSNQLDGIKVFFIYLENDELRTYASKDLVFQE
ncbi:FAD:protein FMN transferase [Wenyingzhuangia sp. IMCC45533]